MSVNEISVVAFALTIMVIVCLMCVDLYRITRVIAQYRLRVMNESLDRYKNLPPFEVMAKWRYFFIFTQESMAQTWGSHEGR